MAEFELSMKYSPPPAKAGMRCLALLFPLWGIICPAALVLFIVLLLRLPAHISLLHSLGIIGGLISFSLICALLAIYCDDDQIKVSKEGLVFPLRFLSNLRRKNQFKWSEMTAIKLDWQRHEIFSTDENITLSFDNGGHARLALNLLNKKELEQFFIAFEVFAFKCQRDAELSDFEEYLQGQNRGDKWSVTEKWDRTLAQHFAPATFVPMEPESQLQNGQYQIIKQLAFGGFSAVYLARRLSHGFVVIKEACLAQNEEVQSKANQLFEREAQTMAGLNHSGICRMLDHFNENGRQYIVLEQIKGADLNKIISETGPQNTETVINIARQIVETLQYLHGQKPPVIHRDISPDNILLRPDGKIVLIDFGASKEIVGNFTGTIIGKQSYIAPEQLRGKAQEASDIYSMGATLCFLMTGKAPTPLETSILPLENSEEPTKSDRLKILIRRCTDIDPGQRPDGQTILAELICEGEKNEAITV